MTEHADFRSFHTKALGKEVGEGGWKLEICEKTAKDVAIARGRMFKKDRDKFVNWDWAGTVAMGGLDMSERENS